MTATRTSVWWVTVPVVMLGAPVSAGDLGVSPYVAYGVVHDSNLFRVADDAERPVTGDDERGDTIRHRTLGLALEWPISRQQIMLEAEASEFRYNHFDPLDHSENEVRAAWEFEVGPAVHGTAGYRRQRYLDDFSDRNNAQPDFIRRHEPQLEAYLDVTPDWRGHARVRHSRVDHSLDSERRFDRRENQGLLELQYRGIPDSLLGTGVETIDGKFPGREAGDPLSRTFLQNTAFIDSNWKYSGISRLQTRLGYTHRNNSGGDDRDFSGITGRLRYERTISGKTRLYSELFRQIYSVDDVEANSVEESGARLGLNWTYSPKLDLTTTISRRTQDYQAVSGGGSRRDTVDEFVAESTYRPYRELALVINARAIRRDSNAAGESYDALIGGLAVRVMLEDVLP